MEVSGSVHNEPAQNGQKTIGYEIMVSRFALFVLLAGACLAQDAARKENEQGESGDHDFISYRLLTVLSRLIVNRARYLHFYTVFERASGGSSPGTVHLASRNIASAYSYRNATIGSTCAARRAGMNAATNAT